MWGLQVQLQTTQHKIQVQVDMPFFFVFTQLQEHTAVIEAHVKKLRVIPGLYISFQHKLNDTRNWRFENFITV